MLTVHNAKILADCVTILIIGGFFILTILTLTRGGDA